MRSRGAGKVTLLLREPVGTTINRGSIGGLIHPLRLCIDVHVMREHIGQLIVLLANGLLIVGARAVARWDVERGTRGGGMGHAGHGGGTNASRAKASEEGRAIGGSWGGGHGQLRWVEGSGESWTG